MSYAPHEEYTPVPDKRKLEDFNNHKNEYVLRPPYQRRTVWSKKQKEQLIDTLFRGFYVPELVLREVKNNDGESKVFEVIDGQQRITTVQLFMEDGFPVPVTLKDLGEKIKKNVGKKYTELPQDIQRFFRELTFQCTIIKGIASKNDSAHQEMAANIFWRLQQGESLNRMEVFHASITSRVRHFLVKYADDVSFDYDKYCSLDKNPDKHKFFSLIRQENNRMQHLSLMGRLLLIEIKKGYTDIKDDDLGELIEGERVDDPERYFTYETETSAKSLLRRLKKVYEIFEKGKGKKGYAWPEYLTVSFYLLIRHIDEFYVWDDAKDYLYEFLTGEFYERWSNRENSDLVIHAFRGSRQQSKSELLERELILRHLFFDFIKAKQKQIRPKDEKRYFDEAERIKIYRNGNGICVMCKDEGKPERECKVPWDDYEADHIIPWSRGGNTDADTNAQVLCRFHNQKKGAKLSE